MQVLSWLVALLNDSVAFITLPMVLGYGRLSVVNLGVVAHVGGRVVRGRLGLLV